MKYKITVRRNMENPIMEIGDNVNFAALMVLIIQSTIVIIAEKNPA